MRSAPLDKTDRLLNELEDAARSDASDAQFLQQFLDYLRLIVGGESAGYCSALPIQGQVLIASSGSPPAVFSEAGRPAPDPSVLDSESTYIAPVGRDPVGDFLFITFRDSIPASGRPALTAITQAFLEILSTRWLRRFEAMEQSRSDIEQLVHRMLKTASIDEVAELVAEQFALIVSADRGSVIAHYSFARSKLLSVSTCHNLDRSSAIAGQIVSRGEQAHTQNTAVVSPEANQNLAPESDAANSELIGPIGNWIAIPLCLKTSKNGLPSSMLLEWYERDEMMSALPALKQFYPQISTAWSMQSRWLAMPSLIRSSQSWTSVSRNGSWHRPWIRWALACTLAIATAWGLSRPVDMMIESQATLEPVSKSTLFASADSYLQTLHVNDGQSVSKDMALATLRSPTLELQIEETTGQLRAIAEKRASLRVALNQSSQSSNEAEVNRTRISSELVVLQSQEKHAQERLAFLHGERQLLQLNSPMNGIVVARDLQRELRSRPLRRGDPLFQVVDTQGDWQLRIHIADRDAGYVVDQMAQGNTAIEFQLESRPGQYFAGKLSEVANAMEPSSNGEVLVAFANIDKGATEYIFSGATAKTYVRCGKQPVWFVWCRPWVESIQKNAWLFPFRDKAGQN